MKKKHRAVRGKKWMWITASLLSLLLLIVLILPSILSTSPFRQLILARVNQSLPGHASVGQWSLGWISGVHETIALICQR